MPGTEFNKVITQLRNPKKAPAPKNTNPLTCRFKVTDRLYSFLKHED